MNNKKCTKCKIVKLLNEFSNSPNGLYGKKSTCKSCDSQWNKLYRIKNNIKLCEKSREYYNNHKDKAKINKKIYEYKNKEKIKLTRQKYKIKNRDRILKEQKIYRHKPSTKQQILKNRLKTKYNMTLEQYDHMFEEQNGLCAICGQSETRLFNGSITRLCVDHNHKTGKIRKLLCHRCNSSIGQFEDNIELLAKAIQYLEENK